MRLRVVGFVFALFFASSALGQTSDGVSIGEPLTKADLTSKLKFDVPSSAGFAILGVSPENVLTPRKGSELALGLLNGLDQEGNFQSGLAIEANPYFWLLPEKVQLDSYLNDRRYRYWSGFSFSLATASGQEEPDKADRIGFGVNYSYDFDDPLFSPALSECVFAVQEQIGDEYLRQRQNIGIADSAVSAMNGDAGQKAAAASAIDEARDGLRNRLQKEGEKQVDKCFEDKVKWNRRVFQLGIAVHNTELNGDTPIDENGESAWISYSHGMGRHYQVTLHSTFGNDLLVSSGDSLMLMDRFFGGIKVRTGSAGLRGFVEAGYTDEESDTTSDSYWKASIGTEIHLRDGIFLQLVYGDSFGANGEKDNYFSGQIKWAISPSSAFQ